MPGLEVMCAGGINNLRSPPPTFPESHIVPKPSIPLIMEGVINGDCNVISSDSGIIADPVVRSSGYEAAYTIGEGRFSTEPLALATPQDDPVWSEFVYWIVQATFYAEEGITQGSADEMPTTNLFGPSFTTIFQYVVRSVLNYGEIYERTMEIRQSSIWTE